MTEPALTVERHPAPSQGHPLATKTGIELLQHLISASVAWSGCTTPQRVLLSELCPPVAEVLLRDGAVGLEQLPMLPTRVRQVSRDALHRRGLVDQFGRLTGKAVHAWFYAGRTKETGDAA